MKKVFCLGILLFFCSAISYAAADKAGKIVLYNWKDYTDKSILDDFEKETGIKVILEEYETKDMMLSEVQSEPEKFDVLIASDSTVSFLKQFRLISELDLSKIPNYKFIKKEFRNSPFDPGGKYAVTGYLLGTLGLAINTNFVPADSDSWAMLWDKQYKGKIALLDDTREAMTPVLKYSNFSLNTKDSQELGIAKQNALLLRNNGVQFGDTLENLEKVMSGELWIAQVYNGDVIYLAGDRKDIKYVLPKEGYSLSVDNFVISSGTEKMAAAYQLINYFLEPRNAARSSVAFSYPSAVEAEAFIDKRLLDNPVVYPSREVLQRGEFFADLGETENEYIKIFNLLKQKEQ